MLKRKKDFFCFILFPEWPGSSLFAYKIFYYDFNKNEKITPKQT